MEKRLRVNRNKWPNKSKIMYRSFHTRQRGHLWWKDEVVNGLIHFMWKGHEFFAKDRREAMDYIHEIKEIF